MQTKFLLLLAIVVVLMLLFFVMQSGKRISQTTDPFGRLWYTLRSIALMVAVLLFLIFSVLR
jgi:hypothetical protein